ncbi:hypothetical protein WOA01_04120 [Methylocystis sp. IM2]|uniref:hypothetical protein n=1 Tax=Methylocystis sp. IM2 TaxID=3136563 RepID=UPI0030FB8F02
MEWLIDRVGRPSSRDGGKPQRNPDWPDFIWRSAERAWPDNTRTTEWSIEVVFASEDLANAFRERWRDRLSGGGRLKRSYARRKITLRLFAGISTTAGRLKP